MEWSTIFRQIPPELRDELPAELRSFQWSANGSMAKAWYGNKALHYEIWIRHRARVLELGLHFEADELTNARLLAAFRARTKDVTRGLGTPARIEEWDKGWARVWEPFPLGRPEEEFGQRIRARFIDYVRTLEPILRDELPSDVEWKIAPPRQAAKVTSSRRSR